MPNTAIEQLTWRSYKTVLIQCFETLYIVNAGKRFASSLQGSVVRYDLALLIYKICNNL